MASSGENTKSNLSAGVRKKWPGLSQTFGCLFNSKASKLPETNLIEHSKAQRGKMTSAGKKEKEGIDGRLDEVKVLEKSRVDGATKGKFSEDASFCTECDLIFPQNIATKKEFIKFHENTLNMSKEIMVNFTICKKYGPYAWNVFQIVDHEERRIHPEIIEKFDRFLFGQRCFTSYHPTKYQVFVAATDTNPARIMGYCQVVPSWVYEGLTYNPWVKDEAAPPEFSRLTVIALWVHKPDRRQGVASSLFDSVRNHFFDDIVVPKEHVSIRFPTFDGVYFARTYFKDLAWYD